MKKVLWLIVCLMTMMVGFTSCSSDDENENSTENYSYLNGEWVNAEGGNTTFIIHDGWMNLVDATGRLVERIQFEIGNNIIILQEESYLNGQTYKFDPIVGKIYKMTSTEFEFCMFGNKGEQRCNLKRKIN